jgi:adenine-specific DNA-methyltransferase
LAHDDEQANYAGCIIVKSNPRGSQSVEHLAYLHEYLLIYCKDIQTAQIIGHALTEEMADEYKYEDGAGKFRYLGLRQRGGFWRKNDRPLLHYAIYANPDNGNVSLEKDKNHPIEIISIQPTTGEAGTWRWGKEKVQKESHLLVAKTVSRDGRLEWDVFQKDYLNSGDDVRRTKAKSIWDEKALNYQNGSIEVKVLFDGKTLFDYPKPVYLLRRIFEMIDLEDDLILDFFSGSATTTHAVMQMNAEDSGKRKFIMVQLLESTNETSEAYNAGFKNIWN